MNGPSEASRRQAALALAEELLGNIELGELPPVALVRKASRLARLLDDEEALAWLRYEIGGYPPGTLDPSAWAAAKRSNRVMLSDDGSQGAHTLSVGHLQTDVQGGLAQIGAATAVFERDNARAAVNRSQAMLDGILGAV